MCPYCQRSPAVLEAVSGVFLPLAAADLALGLPMRLPASAKAPGSASERAALEPGADLEQAARLVERCLSTWDAESITRSRF